MGPKSKSVPLAAVRILADRQRKDLGDIPELAESIKTKGLLQPIVVRPDPDVPEGYILAAGERRFRAHEHLGLAKIDIRLFSDLSQEEAEVIELEENIKRKDLTWQERAKAIARIHKIKAAVTPSWTQKDTSKLLGYAENSGSITMIGQSIEIVEHLEDPRVSLAPTLATAYNSVSRKQQRMLSDIANEIIAPAPPPKVLAPGEAPPPPAPDKAVLNLSFLEWAPKYEGQPFNFIHCDFPYGIDLQDSDQMGQHNKLYEDGEEIYWELLNCLADNIDKLAYPSCHLMFWYSPKFDRQTRDFFAERLPQFNVQDIPLVWLKSDNKGILSDAKRRPRNILEFALIASRGDRLLVKPVANGYAAPTASNKIHPSEKPEPVLRHFFQMFVDERSLVLDPTCGGGSALRAADSMGAERVLGLELDEEFSKAANGAFSQARAKRKLAEKAA